MTLPQRLLGEGIGTAFLLAAIVGSGIMAERLSAGNAALALLANAVATGCALLALLLTVGPVSGAHFNPVVSVALAARGDFPWRDVPAYVLAQFGGAMLGVVVAHAMFGLPLVQIATRARGGCNLAFSEFVATAGLLGVVLLTSRLRPQATPAAVAAWITAAYWFTASTAFANPAVTVARAFTATFTGIAPADVGAFVTAQAAACAVAVLVTRNTLRA